MSSMLLQFWACVQTMMDVIWSATVIAKFAIGRRKGVFFFSGSIPVLKEKPVSQGLPFIFCPKRCSGSRKILTSRASGRDRVILPDFAFNPIFKLEFNRVLAM